MKVDLDCEECKGSTTVYSLDPFDNGSNCEGCHRGTVEVDVNDYLSEEICQIAELASQAIESLKERGVSATEAKKIVKQLIQKQL